MGLLDHLWDDTVAGPRPDKLRKYSSFNFRAIKESEVSIGKTNSGDVADESSTKVTRSIKIVRPPGNLTVGIDSPPASPASGSTPPVSPYFGGRENSKFRRRSTSDVYDRATAAGSSGPRSFGSPYDV
ncbi:hypothetical protein GIB67_004560 [Kingdonia uniflora]|uniref:Uncharacterized protein n=1 Tax=Kingdonia uniflora TaxID=39325 RepID=A0A7J7ML03_9MAGN|nr:hypothetical protein GIB67_004560 [Kingdonia uniflora]